MFCYSRKLILVTDFLKIVLHCSQKEAVKTRYFSEKKLIPPICALFLTPLPLVIVTIVEKYG